MTKKQNTILFILIGTIVEVILAVLFIIILVVASVYFTKGNQSTLSVLFPVCMICGVLAGMIVYQRIAYWVIVKFNLEDKLDPLLPQKFRGKKRKD